MYIKHAEYFNEFVSSTKQALYYIQKRLIWQNTIALNINAVNFDDMICMENFGDSTVRLNVFSALGPILHNYTKISN